MKKRIGRLILAVLLVTVMAVFCALSVSAEACASHADGDGDGLCDNCGAVKYYAWNDAAGVLEESWNTGSLQPGFAPVEPTEITSADSLSLEEGWYIVRGSDVTVGERIDLNGDVRLILADGAKLTAQNGIRVCGTDSFTVYAQSTDETTMGRLTVPKRGDYDYNAGIGNGQANAVYDPNGGTIAIHGGYFTVAGGEGSAAIGGGQGRGIDSISIYGGVFDLSSNYTYGHGAMIGAGDGTDAYCGSITVTGGKFANLVAPYHAAAIGGGEASTVGTITISGGIGKLTPGSGAEPVGAGANGTCGTVTWPDLAHYPAIVNGVGYLGYRPFPEKAGDCRPGHLLYYLDFSDDLYYSAYPFSAGSLIGDQAALAAWLSPEGEGYLAQVYSETVDTDADGLCDHCGGLVCFEYDEEEKEFVLTCSNPEIIEVTSSTASLSSLNESGGWYYVGESFTIPHRLRLYGDIHLILENDATLTAPKGIGLNPDSSLTIYARTLDEEHLGAITVTSPEDFLSAIGSYALGVTCGDITIHGGRITAIGGHLGTAIGSSRQSASEGGRSWCGNITINGGVIAATGGPYAAAIGGDCGDITINGGKITAAGYFGFGAGIGGFGSTVTGDITINGGEITAYAGDTTPGIGSGHNSAAMGNITITGGKIKATGAVSVAIGGGYYSPCGNITITGGIIEATSGTDGNGRCAPAIGGGYKDADSTSYCGDISITGGFIKAKSQGDKVIGCMGAASSSVSVSYGDAFCKVAEDGTVFVGYEPVDLLEPTCSEAGHLAYVRDAYTDMYYTPGFPFEECDVIGGTTEFSSWNSSGGDGYLAPLGHLDENEDGVCERCYQNAVYYAWDETDQQLEENRSPACIPLLSNAGASLPGGWYVVSNPTPGEKATVTIGHRITFTSDVHLILSDDVTLKVNGGIGLEENVSIDIYATTLDEAHMGGILIESTDAYRAGIGGNGDCGDITIHGGNIKIAEGGYYASGIGAGYHGTFGSITINGGTVYAKGYGYASGIGTSGNSVWSGPGSHGKLTNTITINGGKITAIGGNAGAGIGSAPSCAMAEIIINGGEVTATGGGSAPGIGSGSAAETADIIINGGVIRATGGDNSVAIGGGVSGHTGKIIINGGIVEATASKNFANEPLPAIGISTGDSFWGTWSSCGGVEINGGYVRAVSDADEIIGGVNYQSSGCKVEYADGLFRSVAEDGSLCVGYEAVERVNPTCIAAGHLAYVRDDYTGDFYAEGFPFETCTLLCKAADSAAWLAKGGAGYLPATGHVDENGDMICDVCGSLPYYAWNATTEQLEEYATTAYTVFDPSVTELDSGWYFIQNSTPGQKTTVTITDRINLYGDVHLILADDVTLNAKNGIGLASADASVSIYATTLDEAHMGGIKTASPDYYFSAIGTNKDISTTGGVTVHGGIIDVKSSTSAAAIGAGYNSNFGDITINGGVITATGGSYSPAIGSWSGSMFNSTSDGKRCGNITINGGKVTARGGDGYSALDYPGASAIGGSAFSFCGNITINGGEVKAYGGEKSSGIGGNCGDITINGGKVEAHGHVGGGAGIGSGIGTTSTGNITITGGEVTASAGEGAAIGSGEEYAAVGDITITDGKVRANGGRGSVAIGGGFGSGCGSISITGGIIEANGGAAVNEKASPAIGGGRRGADENSYCGAISITGGFIRATSQSDTFIGCLGGRSASVTYGDMFRTVTDDGVLIIGFEPIGHLDATCTKQGHPAYVRDDYSGNYFAEGFPFTSDTLVAAADGLEAWLSEGGEGYLAPLGHYDVNADFICDRCRCGEIYYKWNNTEKRFDPEYITEAVIITPDSRILNGGWYVVTNPTPGQKATVTVNGRLKLKGDTHLILENDVTLEVTGGIGLEEGVSIDVYACTLDEAHMGGITSNPMTKYVTTFGGNEGAVAGNITFHGGVFDLTGSYQTPAIGSGYWSSCGDITINGGVFTLTGGLYAAGIGGWGNAVWGENECSTGCGDIIINGGKITVTARAYGAAIGGGNNSHSGDIVINGGEIIAIADEESAAIGAGKGSLAGNIFFNGGKVKATGGKGAPAIGPGSESRCGVIFFNGALVEAIAGEPTDGGYAAPAIGAGREDYSQYISCGDITFNGGWVKATSANEIIIGTAGSVPSVNVTYNVFRFGEDDTVFVGFKRIPAKEATCTEKGHPAYVLDGNTGNFYSEGFPFGEYTLFCKAADSAAWLAENGGGYLAPLRHIDENEDGVCDRCDYSSDSARNVLRLDPTCTESGHLAYVVDETTGDLYSFGFPFGDYTLFCEAADSAAWLAENGGGYLAPLGHIDENGDGVCDRCGGTYYCAWNTATGQFDFFAATNCTPLTSGMTQLEDGWYIAKNPTPGEKATVRILARMKVTGDVHLILDDLVTLEVVGGFKLQKNASISIYARTLDEIEMGGITVTNPGAQNTALGGDIGNLIGNITIHGGILNLTGGEKAPAIGPGYHGFCGDVTIYGGIITATGGSYAAAIGGSGGPAGEEGGKQCAWGCGDITIYGGRITAIGGKEGGAGIGGGNNSFCGAVTIYDGEITVTGSERAAGIGAGWCSLAGDITINGGRITVTGGKGAPAIGTGSNSDCGDLLFNGGLIQAIAGEPYGEYAAPAIGGGRIDYTSGYTCGDITFNGSLIKATSADQTKIGYLGTDATVTLTYNGVHFEDGDSAYVGFERFPAQEVTCTQPGILAYCVNSETGLAYTCDYPFGEYALIGGEKELDAWKAEGGSGRTADPFGHPDDNEDGRCDVCGKLLAESGAVFDFAAVNLALESDLAFRFKGFLNDPNPAPDAYMEFTVGSLRTESIPLKDATVDASGRYVFTCLLNVLEAGEQIRVTFVDGEETVERNGTISVSDYLNAVAALHEGKTGEIDDKTVELVNATANYLHYAQIALDETHKNYTVGTSGCTYTLVEARTALNAKTKDDLIDYKAVKTTSSGFYAIPKTSRSLLLDDKTSIVIYLTPGGSFYVPSVTVTDSEGRKVAFISEKQTDGRFRVVIPEIGASALGESFTVSIDNGKLTFTNLSALSYAYSVLAGETSEANRNAVSALYAYSDAALDYKRVTGQ